MKITNFVRLNMLPLTKKRINLIINKNIFTNVKINLIVISKHIGKFETMIIKLENIGLLQFLYET